jgi:deoxyribonuclease V
MPPVKQLHRWDVTYHEAVDIQKKLRQEISFAPLKKEPGTVAGADVSFDRRKETLYAAVVVFKLPSLEVVEQAIVHEKAAFPYIPGLLSFREAPVVSKAFERLSIIPDVLLCDGQGVAHPRGFGLASHLGLLFGLPSIGCAKSRLCGEHGEVGPAVGDWASLKLNGRTAGAVLRTRKRVKPVYVSAGHMINLRGAIRIVLRCGAGYRIPEPTRIAHHFVTDARLGNKPSRSRQRR